MCSELRAIARGHGDFGQFHRRLAPASRRGNQDAHRRRSLAFCVTWVALAVLHKLRITTFRLSTLDRRANSIAAVSSCGSRSSTMHDACQTLAAVLPDPSRLSADHGSARFRRRSRGGPMAGSRASCTTATGGPCVSRRCCGPLPASRSGHAHGDRPMLRFRTPSSGPLGDIRSAERWIASLPANDPLAAQRSIVAELHKLAARTARRTPAVLEAVFVVDMQRRTRSCATSRRNTWNTPSRSPKIEDQLWQALSELAQAFGACYAAFAREISDPVPRNKWQAVLPLADRAPDPPSRAATRSCASIAASGGPAKWTELLHAVHARLLAAHRARAGPPRPDGRPTTIERQFLMRPGPAARRTRQPRRRGSSNGSPRSSRSGASRCACTLKPTSATSFYVDLAGTRGLPAPLAGRRSKAACCSSTRSPSTRSCMQNGWCWRRRSEASRARARSRTHGSSSISVVKLASRSIPSSSHSPGAASGSRERPRRRRRRLYQHRRLRALGHAMPGIDAQRGPQFRQHDGARGLRPRAQREPSCTREMARRRLACFADARRTVGDQGHQRVRLPPARADERRDGPHAQHARRDRPSGQTLWAMGIVRRMRRLSTEDAEIGLQLIANTLVGAELTEQRKARDDRLFGRRRGHRDRGRQFHGLFLSFKRQAREEPAVQSLIVPAVEYHASQALHAAHRPVSVAHDPAWAAARTARGLGLDHGHRSGLRGIRRRRRRLDDLTAPDGSMVADRYRRDLSRRTAGTSRRNSTSRTPAARAGRTIAPALRCTGRTSAGETARTRSGICSSRRTGCPTRSRRMGVGTRRQDRADTSATAGNGGCAHGGVPAGRGRVPLSFLFGPEALEYRLNDSDARIAFVDPQSLPNLAPIRDRCPGIAHVVGVAGRGEAWITPYEALLERASPRSTRSRRARAIRRSSSTPAARPGRRRAR